MPLGGKSRPPNAEIERRIMIVYRLICSGVRRGADIIEYVQKLDHLPAAEQKEKGWIPWKIDPSQIYTYLQRATTMFRDVAKVDADKQRGELIEQSYEVYRRAYAAGNYSAAMRALNEIARLRGLATENINLRGGVDIAMLRQRTEELRKRKGGKSGSDTRDRRKD